MSTIADIIGKRLRNQRMKRGWSQEKLAENAGLHPTYIGQVERGEKNLTVESLDRICQAMNVSLSSLFEGINPCPAGEDIPFQCYEMVNDMDEKAQGHILRILLEMDRMRREL